MLLQPNVFIQGIDLHMLEIVVQQQNDFGILFSVQHTCVLIQFVFILYENKITNRHLNMTKWNHFHNLCIQIPISWVLIFLYIRSPFNIIFSQCLSVTVTLNLWIAVNLYINIIYLHFTSSLLGIVLAFQYLAIKIEADVTQLTNNTYCLNFVLKYNRRNRQASNGILHCNIDSNFIFTVFQNAL